ncbi:PREDICTED: RNA polymerase II C-terminal domain phosphatase-like 4-like [Fragaria vesca subsp. vesca]
MTVATVSPILHNIDDLDGFLTKNRRLDSDHSEIASTEKTKRHSDHSEIASIEKTKRRKITDTSNQEISKEARLAYYKKSSSSGVRYGSLHKGLGLSDGVIDQLRNQNTNNLLLNHKKLHLVLDLDHTLLNTTSLDKMSQDEEYLKTQTQSDHSLQHVHIVDTPNMKVMTKLRPYIRTFLMEASQMFELSIYTMGTQDYALEMAKLLDPANQIFGGRVISRSDSTDEDRKALDNMLARESAVVILDDTKDVWQNNNQDNVIVMPRYHFFKSSCQQYGISSSCQQYGISNSKPYSELKTDECDRYGGAYLASVLQLLRHVHTIFFNEVELKGWDLIDRDVRPVLKILQKEVLKGCKLVFSHIWPSNVKADTHPLWKLAEQLGATCSTQVDPSVTHVVAADARTQKSCWAVKKGKFLVNPQWIDTTLFMWQRQPEYNFPCQTNIKQI